jgi:hypothetical protein
MSVPTGAAAWTLLNTAAMVTAVRASREKNSISQRPRSKTSMSRITPGTKKIA